MNKLLESGGHCMNNEYRVFKCKTLKRIIHVSKEAIFAQISYFKDGNKLIKMGGWICGCGEWTESGKENHVVIR